MAGFWIGMVPLWWHRQILSLDLVKYIFRIKYDSAMGTDSNTFVVHKKDVNQHKLIQSTRVLYYCDVSDNSKKNDFALVNTVSENEKK